MFHAGQIVWDWDAKEPVKVDSYAGTQWGINSGKRKRLTHFIELGYPSREFATYIIALPESVEDALQKLNESRITPATLPESHCYKCFNWLSNHKEDGACL